MIEPYILFAVAAINFIIFSLVISQGWRKRPANQAFLISNFFVIMWSLGAATVLYSDTLEIVQFGAFVFYLSPMLLMMFLSIFATNFLSDESKTEISFGNIALVVVTFIGVAILLINPSILIQELVINQNSANHIEPSLIPFTLYFLYFTVAFSITFYQLYARISSHTGKLKKQLQYVYYGMLTSATLSLPTNLILPMLGISSLVWLGPTWTLLYVITVLVSIMRHGLFDIRAAAVRTSAYLFAFGSLIGFYFLSIYTISLALQASNSTASIKFSSLNILLSLIIAIAFQPIKTFFDRFTDRIFFRNSYKPDEFYVLLSEVLAGSSGLSELIAKAKTAVESTFKPEYAHFYLYKTAGSSKSNNRLPQADARAIQASIEHNRSVVSTDEVSDRDPIKKVLLSHKIGLVLPLHRKKELIGLLILGNKRSGKYVMRDVKTLETVADELVIAIENAESVEQVRRTNAHLEQAIEAATAELRTSNARLKRLDASKDEFLSMASHQLRTPLTSVKGYLSMVLEGDVGKVSQAQKKVLEEAFSSSERMVHLIHDFLNVSRLQTGKFMLELEEVNLSSLVADEVKSLVNTASSHGLILKLEDDAGPSVMTLDNTKIRQVVMNYIDNAIFYSHPDTTIEITLKKSGDDILFEVHDTGIGVPVAEQAQLFEKFYRATNARKQRPDGTGVGLYLAKKIIDAHGGTILFESKEGKGSTFGFRLPLKPKEIILKNSAKKLKN